MPTVQSAGGLDRWKAGEDTLRQGEGRTRCRMLWSRVYLMWASSVHRYENNSQKMRIQGTQIHSGWVTRVKCTELNGSSQNLAQIALWWSVVSTVLISNLHDISNWNYNIPPSWRLYRNPPSPPKYLYTGIKCFISILLPPWVHHCRQQNLWCGEKQVVGPDHAQCRLFIEVHPPFISVDRHAQR